MANRFGLGDALRYPMSPSKADPDQGVEDSEPMAQIGCVGDTRQRRIGQGFMLASPLQLAVMTARLATGRAVTPAG